VTSFNLKESLQRFYISENPDFFPMNVRVHTENSDQITCYFHAQNTVDTRCLSDWALLD
jgi:hypothetical protein